MATTCVYNGKGLACKNCFQSEGIRWNLGLCRRTWVEKTKVAAEVRDSIVEKYGSWARWQGEMRE